MRFASKAREEFEIESVTSDKLDALIQRCGNIYAGIPDWVSDEDNVKTINFAKTICEEVAKLTMLGTKITIDGSPRAEYLQGQIDSIYYNLRSWVEYAAAYGTIILKPNGKSVDLVLPGDFMVTDEENGNIRGIVFYNYQEVDKKHYTRLEYHRFINDQYWITNKCYVGTTKNDISKTVSIEDTPWANLAEEGVFHTIDGGNIERPLFAVLRMPNANNVDIGSALSLPVFYEALEELKGLDVSISRNDLEIFDSEKIVFMDADRLLTAGGKVAKGANGLEQVKKERKIPHWVRMVEGTGQGDIYHEVQPSLNPDLRIKGINNYLSFIGFKCGFSNGYFVFDQKTGMVTATQVESDDRRTITFIKDVRDQLESCLTTLIYAIDKFADAYTEIPAGKYELVFDFGDITYNREEDRLRWWNYVVAGKVPAWKYFVKFEGMSEEDAKEMVEEAMPNPMGLFSE